MKSAAKNNEEQVVSELLNLFAPEDKCQLDRELFRPGV